MKSTQRMITASASPPWYPEYSPSRLPRKNEARAMTSGPKKALRVPAMTRENTSRPSESVPSQCAPDGGALTIDRC